VLRPGKGTAAPRAAAVSLQSCVLTETAFATVSVNVCPKST
jgi:hypothetical protein